MSTLDRLKTLNVSDSLLLRLLGGNIAGMAYMNVGDLIPGDAKIIEARVIHPGPTVVLTLWSASFPEVAEGEQVPELSPVLMRL